VAVKTEPEFHWYKAERETGNRRRDNRRNPAADFAPGAKFMAWARVCNPPATLCRLGTLRLGVLARENSGAKNRKFTQSSVKPPRRQDDETGNSQEEVAAKRFLQEGTERMETEVISSVASVSSCKT
jgi:hypothetical protein